MSSKLRFLERVLAMEYAEVVAERVVDDYVLRWNLAAAQEEELPDEIDFSRRMYLSGLFFPTAIRVFKYLARCRRDGAEPDPRRILEILMSWYRQRHRND